MMGRTVLRFRIITIRSLGPACSGILLRMRCSLLSRIFKLCVTRATDSVRALASQTQKIKWPQSVLTLLHRLRYVILSLFLKPFYRWPAKYSDLLERITPPPYRRKTESSALSFHGSMESMPPSLKQCVQALLADRL